MIDENKLANLKFDLYVAPNTLNSKVLKNVQLNEIGELLGTITDIYSNCSSYIEVYDINNAEEKVKIDINWEAEPLPEFSGEYLVNYKIPDFDFDATFAIISSAELAIPDYKDLAFIPTGYCLWKTTDGQTYWEKDRHFNYRSS